MLIIVSRDHASLYGSLKPAQEASGRDRVILDQRVAERRQGDGPAPGLERRQAERRAPISSANVALMRVLGFSVLDADRDAAAAPQIAVGVTPPARRTTAAAPARKRETPRLRRAG
jgi:hypothetical protein